MSRVRWTGVTLTVTAVVLSSSAAATTPPASEDAPPLPPPQACFAPGTPSQVIEAQAARRTWQFLTSLQPPSGDRYQFDDNARWKTTATDGSGLGQGDPTTLTWSIVPDGTPIPGYAGEPAAPSDLENFLNGVYGSEAVWLPIVESVFERWGELTGITYVYEPNDDGATFPNTSGALGVRGDVRLSGHRIDGTSGILAYNFYPGIGDMVLDTDDGVLEGTSNDSLVLRNVLAHEHGHGLGLSHVCPVEGTKLMEPYLSSAFDGPQHDDILAANRGYGDRFEEADTPGTAASLGSSPAALLEDQLSLDDPSDYDYYSFSVGSGSSVTVTVSPIGDSYESGPQLNSGACSAGSLADTSSLLDLQLEILDRDGSSVLATANANGPGIAEALQNVALSSGSGTYYAVISGQGSGDVQLYALEVDTTAGSPPPTHTVTVSRQGEGTGSVTSSPSGISCGSDCSQSWDEGTVVSLTATPANGSLFDGWSGASDCADGQVTVSADVTCVATFVVDTPETFVLSVSRSGSGTGSVTSSPAGISCGSDCSQSYDDGTAVSLTANPASGSVFSHWSGSTDCTDGQVTMTADRSCTAHFDLAPTTSYTLSVSKAGTGSGTVTSSPSGISCGSDCSESYGEGTTVSLTANPASGSVFSHWSGSSDCTDGQVTMSADRSCTANFEPAPTTSYTLTVTIGGQGGRVTSSPSGIDCGSDCSQSYPEGTQVTLQPIPDSGYVFKDWKGDADCRDGQVTMNGARDCQARFGRGKNVRVKSTGRGRVISSPIGIDCPTDCAAEFGVNDTVELQAVPEPGYELQEWRGHPDCADGVISDGDSRMCNAVFSSIGETSNVLFDDSFEGGDTAWWSSP